MSRNRRRHQNALPISLITLWIVVGVLVSVAGLRYVALKNQRHAVGRQIAELEGQLTDYETRNEVVRTQISMLSSTSALQRRKAEGFIKLTEIQDNRIVRVTNREVPAKATTAAAEIRPVSFEGTAQ